MKFILHSVLLIFFLAGCRERRSGIDSDKVTEISLTQDSVNPQISFALTPLQSDTAFDYYKIELKNNSDTVVYFIYDPAAFDPGSRKNELFCGSYNEDEKYYDAILYNMDHMEISETFKILPHKTKTIFVKWNIKYRSWKKELSLEYVFPDQKSLPVIDDQMSYISIRF